MKTFRVLDHRTKSKECKYYLRVLWAAKAFCTTLNTEKNMNRCFTEHEHLSPISAQYIITVQRITLTTGRVLSVCLPHSLERSWIILSPLGQVGLIDPKEEKKISNKSYFSNYLSVCMSCQDTALHGCVDETSLSHWNILSPVTASFQLQT